MPLERISEKISHETDLVLITEPHNPSGIFSPRDEVLDLARLASEYDAVLLINEVYGGFTAEPSYHAAAENIVVVNSLSKLFGTYWMRLEAGDLVASLPVTLHR